MNRTPAPAAAPPLESFAGLLEQLTQPSLEEDGFPARTARHQSRPLHPLPKSKPEKNKASSEAARLSYEEAIRLHRRRPLDDVDFELDLKPVDPPQPARKNAAAPKTSSSRAAFGPRPEAPYPKQKVSQDSGAQASPATHASRKHSPTPAKPVATAPKAAPPAGAQLTKKRKSADPIRRAIQASQADRGVALETRASQLELRRSIVSLRLSDVEIDRLRQRAAESGISVSAYMRSCVLEAEHLRAQVKQALAEMRAASLRTGVMLAESERLPALIASGPARQSTGWSRFLARSAVFLFGPWLAWRTRT
jgi:hypothetical protein